MILQAKTYRAKALFSRKKKTYESERYGRNTEI